MNETDKVILKWTAANEPLNQLYEIQRSLDGRGFTTIGTANGKGHNINLATYVIEDLNPVTGLSYYRLVNKNANGSISYSEWKAVNRAAIAASYLLVYPNPVSSLLSLKIAATQAEKTRVDILDVAGRVVKTLSVSLYNGEQTLQIDMNGLSKGSYVVKMRLGQKVETQMINKL